MSEKQYRENHARVRRETDAHLENHRNGNWPASRAVGDPGGIVHQPLDVPPPKPAPTEPRGGRPGLVEPDGSLSYDGRPGSDTLNRGTARGGHRP